MSEKSTVYAIKCFNLQGEQFVQQGFLLFPNEQKGVGFIEFCQNIKEKQKEHHYEPHGYVEVNDFFAKSVDQRRNFYVDNLERATSE